MHTTHHILPEGIALTLWHPAGAGESRIPLIILCHGFCGVRSLLLPAYAGAFVRAGFAAVTFDYRGFGDSEGERGRLLPALQAEDILTVTEWARTQPGIDRGRIGLWGTSLGGGHVFVAASRDPGIKCVVSQLGFADGAGIVTGHLDEDEKKTFTATLDGMHERKNHTGKETFVSIPRVMSDPESRAFFERHREQFPEMNVKIPFLTVREIMHYRPAAYAGQVKCPTLVVTAERDTVNPPEQGAALFDAVSAPVKMLYQVPGARHYDIYEGEHFERVSRIQTDWFRTHL